MIGDQHFKGKFWRRPAWNHQAQWLKRFWPSVINPKSHTAIINFLCGNYLILFYCNFSKPSQPILIESISSLRVEFLKSWNELLRSLIHRSVMRIKASGSVFKALRFDRRVQSAGYASRWCKGKQRNFCSATSEANRFRTPAAAPHAPHNHLFPSCFGVP